MLSPPLDMNAKWFAPHVAYTMAKFNMSIIALGLAGELKADGIAVNTLWPRTTIATAAVKNLLGGDDLMRRSRTPEIMADAAHVIFTQDAKTFTGRFCIDDTLLYEHGVRDFEKYRVDRQPSWRPTSSCPDIYPAAARRDARRAHALSTVIAGSQAPRQIGNTRHRGAESGAPAVPTLHASGRKYEEIDGTAPSRSPASASARRACPCGACSTPASAVSPTGRSC